MQKGRLILAQPLDHHRHHVPRAGQPRPRASHGSQALQTPGVQPAIHQGKVLTAVVDLAVVKARRLAVLEQSDVLLAPVAHAR